MGRMADARRKARPAAGAPAAGDTGPPPVAAEGAQDGRQAGAEGTGGTAGGEPEPTPPAETPAPAEQRAPLADDAEVRSPVADDAPVRTPLVLPSSGVAEDILRESGAAEPEAAEPEAPPADHDFVFDDEPARPRAPLVLPSSGLAEDILREAGESTPEVAEPGPGEAGADAVARARAHQFTFFAAPEREARDQPEASEHLVTFLIGREEYGVDVRLVQEIIRVPAITPVPRAPAFAKGVINLRGRIIPVMDFKAKLGLGASDSTQRKARILVVRLAGRLIGLLVDGASQVLKVPVSAIEAAPEEVVESQAGHLRGVAKLRDRLVILVDLPQVLSLELRAAGATP
jgi:purine-binding chemotaxis protein CheW